MLPVPRTKGYIPNGNYYITDNNVITGKKRFLDDLQNNCSKDSYNYITNNEQEKRKRKEMNETFSNNNSTRHLDVNSDNYVDMFNMSLYERF